MSDEAPTPDRDQVRIAAMELQLARSRAEPAYFHGYLMLPLLREGDEVEVEPVVWSDVRSGDVVTYRDRDKFPTRRVIEVRQSERVFVIMGDSIRPRRSWLVPFDDVIGRVVRRRRGDRWMTTRHWRWRLQRTRVLARNRFPKMLPRSVVRWYRRTRRAQGPPVA